MLEELLNTATFQMYVLADCFRDTCVFLYGAVGI